MRFDEMGLDNDILKALREEGYEQPTPIQAQAIPHVLNNRDVMGCAQTGTGKTAAFSIPMIQKLKRNESGKRQRSKIRGLVVSPTRELAIQIGDSIKQYGKYTGLRHTVIYGGVKQGAQVATLKQGVDILVATPGRLLDLIDQGFIRLGDVQFFVLDEADRMLDMGFVHDIKRLVKLLPSRKQSLFFSATMPNDIVDLANSFLNKPVRVDVAPVSSTAETIKQFVYYTNKSTKRNLLLEIVREENIEQALVFTKTKFGADKIVKFLKSKKIPAAAIHGNKSQNARQKALKDFKSGEIQLLVATDIAARGIDIDKLKYVINFDIPNVSETYVHRIGRSGRAGEDGIAFSISEPEENAYIRDIEKLIGKDIDVLESEEFPQTDQPMNNAQKKEANKQKQERKREFHAKRKAARQSSGDGKSKKPKRKFGKNQGKKFNPNSKRKSRR